jgi:hypothetical protein
VPLVLVSIPINGEPMTTKNCFAYEGLAAVLNTHHLFQTTEFQRPNVRAHWGPSLQESISLFLENGMPRFVEKHGQQVADDYVKGLQLLQGVDEVVAAAKVKDRQTMNNAMHSFVQTYFTADEDIEFNVIGLNVTLTDIKIVRLSGLHNPDAVNALVYNGESDSIDGAVIFQDQTGIFWIGDFHIDAAGAWNVKLSGQVDPRHPLVSGSDDYAW